MPCLALLLTFLINAPAGASTIDEDRLKAWKLMQEGAPEASAAWEAVAERAGQEGERCLRAVALYDVGVLANKAGDKRRAQAFFEKALPLHESMLLNVYVTEVDAAWWNFEYLCPGDGPAKDEAEAACLERKRAFEARRRALYETDASSGTETAEDLLAEAERQELRGDGRRSLDLLRRATLAAGGSSRQKAAAALALGEAELRLGEPAKAEDDLYRAFESMSEAGAGRADWLRLASAMRSARAWRGAAAAYWRAGKALAGGSLEGCGGALEARERASCLARRADEAGRRCDAGEEFSLLRQAVVTAAAAQDWSYELRLRKALALQFCRNQDWRDCAPAMERLAARAAAAHDEEIQAEALLSAAGARASLHQLDQARDDAQESRSLYRALGKFPGEHAAVVALAGVASQRGDYGEALKYLDEAVEGDRAHGFNQVEHFADRSRLRAVVGDFAGALADARAILDVAAKNHDQALARDGHRLIASALDDLGDEDTALEEARTAVTMARALGDKKYLASALNEKGIVEMNLALVDRSYAAPAIADLQEAYSNEPWNGTLVNLGDAYWAAGRVDDADKQWERAGHRIGRTSVLYARGRYAEAAEANRKLYAEFERSRDYSAMMFAQTQLGMDEEALGKYDEAAAAYGRAREVEEEARDGLSEGERLHFFAGNDWQIPRLEPLEGLVRVLDKTSAGPAAAFEAAEGTRARVFAEAAARRYGAPETRLPAARAVEESRLRGALAEALKRRSQAFREADTAGFAREDQALRALRAKQAAFVERLRADYPEYAAAAYPRPIGPAAVPLRADEALLEFEVTGPLTKVFVVRGGKVAAVREARISREELGALVERYTGYFEKVSGPDDLAAFDGALSKKLYDLLLAPALETVPAGTRLIIVPDEALAALPFESLVARLPERLQSPAGAHGPAPLGVRYVEDDWDVAYAQSAAALAFSRASRKRLAAQKPLLVVADPVFSKADPRARPGGEAAAPELARAVLERMGLAGERPGSTARREIGWDAAIFPRLDGTAVLAERLVKKVFAGQAAEALTGWDARRSELLSRRLDRYRYLVFATHGILDGDVPKLREPALVLTQLGLKAGDSGFLAMSDVLGLKLSADLVALTACRTGVGRRRAGEGVMGLGRAFQLAGARSALVSLWSVSEESTTLFAERLFQRLREGKTPREAQRLARADLRREGYEHPFFWAPFVLYTD